MYPFGNSSEQAFVNDVLGNMYPDFGPEPIPSRKDFEEFARQQRKTITDDSEKPRWQKKHIKLDRINEVTNHINEFRYKLINIPEIMAQRSKYELSPLTGGPVKLPFGYEVGQGMFSINWMIQNFAKQVPFEFANWEDCCDVAYWLGQYIKILETDIESVSPDIKDIKDQDAVDAYNDALSYLHMARTLDATIAPMAERLASYHNQESVLKVRARELRRENAFRDMGLPGESRRPTIDTRLLRTTQQHIARTR